jgi:hypothetical protein
LTAAKNILPGIYVYRVIAAVDTASICIIAALNMKESGKAVRDMAREDYHTQMAMYIRVIGRITEWMERVK